MVLSILFPPYYGEGFTRACSQGCTACMFRQETVCGVCSHISQTRSHQVSRHLCSIGGHSTQAWVFITRHLTCPLTSGCTILILQSRRGQWNDRQGARHHAGDYRGLLDTPRVPRWQHQEPDEVFGETTQPSRMSMQARRSMFERGNSADEMPHLTKPLDRNVSGRGFESGNSGIFESGNGGRFESGDSRRFESGDSCRFDSGDSCRFESGDNHRFGSGDSATSAPLVEPQDVCLYRHKPVLPPDLAPSQGLGSRMGINKWETTEDLRGQVPTEQDVMIPASEPSTVSHVTSPESLATQEVMSQEVMSPENGQVHAESDAEVCTGEVRRSGGVGGSGGGGSAQNPLWGSYWFYSRLSVGYIFKC